MADSAPYLLCNDACFVIFPVVHNVLLFPKLDSPWQANVQTSDKSFETGATRNNKIFLSFTKEDHDEKLHLQ